MTKIVLIARTAQSIGGGLHPESDFENTSKLSICAGNKTVAVIPYMDQDSKTFHLRRGFYSRAQWIEGYSADK